MVWVQLVDVADRDHLVSDEDGPVEVGDLEHIYGKFDDMLAVRLRKKGNRTDKA